MPETTTRPRAGVRGRARLRRPSVPAPLAALLGAVLLLGVAWALLVPPFQAPDEQSHAGYVQSLVEGPGVPGDPGRAAFSTEQLRAQDAANSDQTAGNLSVNPEWAPLAWERWRQLDASLPGRFRADGGGNANPAWSNPPLFYLYDAIPYAATSGADYFARLTAMRVAAVLWLLVTTLGAWLLAGEVVGRDRLLQLVAAGVAGLLPMVSHISAQVGPDTLLYALWSLALWLGVRILKRGIDVSSAAALLGLVGLAILTKATSYALVPAALFALGVGVWRIRGERPRAMRAAAAGIAALAAPVVTWFLVARALDHSAAAQISTSSKGGGTDVRELASYLWQFYLPRLPFQTSFDPVHRGLPAFHIWVEQGGAAFGWLEVRFPRGVYRLLALLVALIAVAAVARLIATRAQVDRAVAAFLLLASATLIAALHWTDYHNITGGSGAFMQGRYLFPLVTIAGLAVAQALRWFDGAARRVGAGVALGGLFAFQLCSLALVATRFYA